ncbi:hypothetical protein [Marinobacter similis]|nr:hypothetical protein [Marinobacter similis]
MYDNLRYNPDNVDGAQFMITSIGANHNYYNSFWFNDDATLNGFDPYCSEASPIEGRYAREDQERHGEFLIASFLRLFVGGETQFAGYWGGKERLPESACPIGVETCDELIHLSFQQPKDSIIVVDDTLDASSLEQNNLENANSSGATDVLFWCSPSFGGGWIVETILPMAIWIVAFRPRRFLGRPRFRLGIWVLRLTFLLCSQKRGWM